MKKFIKSIPVYLTVAMILCCSVFVPAMATTTDSNAIKPLASGSGVICDGVVYECEGWFYSYYVLPEGSYIINADFDGVYPDELLDALATLGVNIYDCYYGDIEGNYTELSIFNNTPFRVTYDMVLPDLGGDESYLSKRCVLYVNCYGELPVLNAYTAYSSYDGMYYQVFDMFAGFIYGDGAVLTGEQNMVLTILATTAVLFVVVVPFLLVFWFIRMFR